MDVGRLGKLLFWLSFIEGRFEHPQVVVAHDAVEVVFDGGEGGSRPAESQAAVLPVFHATSQFSHGRVAVVDQVRGSQAPSSVGR